MLANVQYSLNIGEGGILNQRRYPQRQPYSSSRSYRVIDNGIWEREIACLRKEEDQHCLRQKAGAERQEVTSILNFKAFW